MINKKKPLRSKKPAGKGGRTKGWVVALKVLLLLIWVGSAVIVSQLVVGYLMLWILGRDTFMQTVSTAVYSALSYTLAFIWLVFATPRVVAKLKSVSEQRGNKRHIDGESESHPSSRNELGLTGTPTWTDIGLAPVGFIITTLLALGLVAIFNVFPWFNADQAQDVGFGTYLTGVDRIIAFVVLVVVAPIAEELIFRGWLYGKLRAVLNTKLADVWSMIISTLLVSTLFGIVHLQWNVGINVFAMSIVLCGLREITGTIYAGILTHMIKNGVAFYLLYVLGIT